jgi:putative transcriptional regulator
MIKFVPWNEVEAVAREAVARIDWARIDAMTEEELTANALSDPDNPPLTEEELAGIRRIVAEREAAKTIAAE